MLSTEELDKLDTDVVASVYEGNETVPTWHQQLAEEVPSNGRDVTYNHMVNPVVPRRWKRGTTKTIQRVARGERRVKNDRFELTVGIDRDDVNDDVSGMVRRDLIDVAFENGQKFAQVKDDLAADVLIGNAVGMDKAPLFGAHHLNPLDAASPQYTNDFSGMPFTPENVARATAIILGQRGPDGLPRKLRATHALLPPNLSVRGDHIFGATQINGTDNVLRGRAQSIIAPELGSTNENPQGDETWYLVVLSGRKRPLVYQRREALRAVALFDPRDPNVWERNELLWTASERFAIAGGYPYLIYRFRP